MGGRRVKQTADLRFVGGFVGTIGLIFFSVGMGIGYRQVQVIKQWPEVQGAVTRSGVRSYYSRSTRMYETDIEFRYRVDGFEYVSPVPPDYASSNAGAMRNKAARYPVGSSHMIKVNPRDPNDARLSEGFTFGAFFLPLIFGILGSILTCVGGAMVYFGIRERRRGGPKMTWKLRDSFRQARHK